MGEKVLDWFRFIMFVAILFTCLLPAKNNIYMFLKHAYKWSWTLLIVMLTITVFTLRCTGPYEFMMKYDELYSWSGSVGGSWIVFLLYAPMLMIVSIIPLMENNLALRNYYELYDYRNQGKRANSGMFRGLCALSLISYCGYAAGFSGICEWIIYLIAPMDHLKFVEGEYTSPSLDWTSLLIGLVTGLIYRVTSGQFRNRYTTV